MEFLIKKAKLQAVSVKWLPTQSISRPIDIQIQRVQWKLYYDMYMYEKIGCRPTEHRKLHIQSRWPRFFFNFQDGGPW